MQARLALCCLVLLASGDAFAQDSLSVVTVVEIAKLRAPQVLEAETRVAEAHGRLVGARAWGNPEIQGVTGKAEDDSRRTEVEFEMPVGLGLRRSRRVRAASAEFHSEEQLAREVKRQAVGAALEAFFRALHADRRQDLARRRVELAEELDRVARERVSSGESAPLESTVAQIELSRGRSELAIEEQEAVSARAELALVLGLATSDPVVQGDLADLSAIVLPDSARIEERPDVQAAEFGVKAAEADHSLAGLGILPSMSFRLNYEDDGGSTVWMPGVALTIPLFDRGQGERVQASARLDRSRIELSRRRTSALAGYEAARRRHAATVTALTELEKNGLPKSADVEGMVEKSYRAGKIDLGSLLVIRRDALETRREHVDRQLDVALRRIELGLTTGGWPMIEE